MILTMSYEETEDNGRYVEKQTTYKSSISVTSLLVESLSSYPVYVTRCPS